MRVGIDVRCFAGGKTTGVEQYTKSLLCEVFAQTKRSNATLEQQDKVHFILFFNAYKDIDVDFSWALDYDHVEIKKFKYPNKLLNIALWYLEKPLIDVLLDGIDIFYMPNTNFIALSRRTKLITTIHDLSYEHFKTSFSLKRKIWHWLTNPRRLASRADAVCTVSQSSRQDIIASYPTTRGKVHVIPAGFDPSQNTLTRNSAQLIEVKSRYELPYKFILYFGTIEPRKNIVSLIQAYDEIRRSNIDIDHKLILAGSKGWNAQEIEDAIDQSLFKNDILVFHNVPARDKEAFYLLGDVFIYPSHFEGFGFPPLEALSCNRPVITSHTTSLSEVVGDNAIMIDPTRPEEIQRTLMEILSSKNLMQDLTKGTDAKKYVDEHSWSRSATKFIELIQTQAKK